MKIVDSRLFLIFIGVFLINSVLSESAENSKFESVTFKKEEGVNYISTI